MNHSQSQTTAQPHPAIMLLPSGSEIVFNGYRILVPHEVELPYSSCEPIAEEEAQAETLAPARAAGFNGAEILMALEG